MEQLKTQRHDTMTFGELVDGIGAKIGVGIENAGGAAALEIDGRTVVLQMADDDLLLVRADPGKGDIDVALPEISLAQFNKIATGTYNAGQIDIQVGKNGQAELVKINNHVWSTSKNKVDLSSERILEVKEAFINALEKGGVKRDAINTIRAKIGLPADMSLPADDAERKNLLAQRFKPLSRADVRSRFCKKGTMPFGGIFDIMSSSFLGKNLGKNRWIMHLQQVK